jgi:superfamily II DNA or RNA helicase
MKIPYVIDNQTHKLADVLNGIMAKMKGQCLDVASAYFTIGGYKLIQSGLNDLGSFRLLLGAEPKSGEQIGLRPDAKSSKTILRADLEQELFSEETLRTVEDLIRYLRQEIVQIRLYDKGFLHAKCYLFCSDRPGQQMLFERFKPVLAIVGSSNFTAPGLTNNSELNLTHKVFLDEDDADDPDAQQAVRWLTKDKPSVSITNQNRRLIKSEVGARAIIELDQWYQRQWDVSIDFKDELIELLDSSKFGTKEYTPYQIYMKALFEYFKDELDPDDEQTDKKSIIELTDFQNDAVKKARKILQKYDGVMVADPVGIGKTWVGKKLLEDFAYHMRQKALVVCPASLRKMWQDELADATIACSIVSQEELGREGFDHEPFGDADVILVDESHNFRNNSSKRYSALENIIKLNGGRGRDGGKKKLILLTATPINNDLLDLYSQLTLITGGDRSYFSGAGIGDLYRYFLRARSKMGEQGDSTELFNLLEEVVIRRSRSFIRKAYPEATINGKKIKFPKRTLQTENYNLEETYQGIYDDVVSGVDSLKLAPYKLESYKKDQKKIDEFERGRGEALVGIFKSRYLKRFESSVCAFRISIRRALEFLKTFESYLLDGKVLKSMDFHRVLPYLAIEDEEDSAPTSRASEIDEAEEAQRYLDRLTDIETKEYSLRRIHEDLQHDIAVLGSILDKVKGITPDKDMKLQKLKELLADKFVGKKVLVFSYYKDTARYLFNELGGDKGKDFREGIGNPHIRRIDGGNNPIERQSIIKAFSPKSNKKPEWVGTDKEIDILFSTDVLSEGQNLQDCGYMINYDLHWNPVRMVQRAGRIDRIGSEYDEIFLHNMFPDEGLEKLLRLVESLTNKIEMINKTGFLDASILGEIVNPQNFNTLRRIREGDGRVIEEQEQYTELASSEFLKQQLSNLLSAGGQELLDSLPDGIHSGLLRENAKGMFFYFTSSRRGKQKNHYWKYYDIADKRIVDNRFIIGNMIACSPDTPRVVDNYDVFDIQEKIIQDILESHQRQRGLESAPKVLEPIQQTIITVIKNYLNHPEVDREHTLQIIRYLSVPMLPGHIKELKKAYSEFQKAGQIAVFLDALDAMRMKFGSMASQPQTQREAELTRDDLHLVCFDYICS